MSMDGSGTALTAGVSRRTDSMMNGWRMLFHSIACVTFALCVAVNADADTPTDAVSRIDALIVKDLAEYDQSPVFDQALATLITDLERQGLLESTLVVVATEFGRKPDYNGDGRSHHPVCFSTILAGGGVKAGYVHGESDDIGYYVEDDEVSVGSFHATIGYAAGLDIEKPATSPSGRPMFVGDGEKPVMEMFA